jgi:hypothetical protein
MKDSVEEKIEICSTALIKWVLGDRNPERKHNKDIEKLFTSQVLLKKLDAFGIDIFLPDALLVILYVCVEGNPGQVQIVLKELLNDIKKRKGPIPAGYIITADDFSLCFMRHFPIMEIPEVNKKFEKLWDEQKYWQGEYRANRCDTVEWWKEVME